MFRLVVSLDVEFLINSNGLLVNHANTVVPHFGGGKKYSGFYLSLEAAALAVNVSDLHSPF